MSTTLRTTPIAPAAPDRAVGAWLVGVAAMIFAMVVIGGITRLTESGLSMVEWRPVTGWLPPLSEAEWQRVFALYQDSPEFRRVNSAMTLAEFKTIFWWEFVHRLWGRLIGVAFFVPLVAFLATGRIHRQLAPRLFGLFLLGGLQGAVGWWMVASGLVHDPAVSQYRLAAHLSLALVLYVAVLWIGLGLLLGPRGGAADRRRWGEGMAVAALLALTIVAGAFVAGLDAGLAYNTFPLMGGQLVPEAYGDLDPWIANWFENTAAVQFNHRLLATATLLAALWLAWRSRDAAPAVAAAGRLVAVAAALQFVLGVATLLAFVPVSLGALHQAGAVLLITALLWWLDRLARA